MIVESDEINKLNEMDNKSKDELKDNNKNEDETKQYEIKANESVNINKLIFSEFAKQNITILEMKKPEATLEDAFMEIIKEGDGK